MKSLENEAIWCGLGVAVMACMAIQFTLIAPKKMQIASLQAEIKQLQRVPLAEPVQEVETVPIQKNCPWEKWQGTWRLAGAFSQVYDCVMSERNAREIDSMRLQKHTLGVSVVLGFDEMPA